MNTNVAELCAGVLGAAPAPESLSALLLRAQAGGPALWITLGLGGLALGLVAERALVLSLRARPGNSPFMDQVAKLVASGNLERAAKLCAASPHEPLAPIVVQGLRRVPEGQAAVHAALDAALAEASPRLGGRLRWLPRLGGLAALVGLGGAAPRLLTLAGAHAPALAAEARAALVDHAVVAAGVTAGCLVAHRLLASTAKRRAEALALQAQRLEGALARRNGRTESGSLRAVVGTRG
jgi:biopolymer transport protein ExbB